MYLYLYLYLSIPISVYIYIYVSVYIGIYIHVYIYIHTYTYTYISIAYCWVPLINYGTSFLAGLVVLSVLGNMSATSGIAIDAIYTYIHVYSYIYIYMHSKLILLGASYQLRHLLPRWACGLLGSRQHVSELYIYTYAYVYIYIFIYLLVVSIYICKYTYLKHFVRFHLSTAAPLSSLVWWSSPCWATCPQPIHICI